MKFENITVQHHISRFSFNDDHEVNILRNWEYRWKAHAMLHKTETANCNLNGDNIDKLHDTSLPYKNPLPCKIMFCLQI